MRRRLDHLDLPAPALVQRLQQLHLVHQHSARRFISPGVRELLWDKDDIESFYVLEGEITFYVGEQSGVRVGAGTFVHVLAGTVHGFRIETETARYLILTTARHGEFYRANTLPARAGGLPPLESIEGSRIARTCEDYDIEFIGPLPAATPWRTCAGFDSCRLHQASRRYGITLSKDAIEVPTLTP